MRRERRVAHEQHCERAKRAIVASVAQVIAVRPPVCVRVCYDCGMLQQLLGICILRRGHTLALEVEPTQVERVAAALLHMQSATTTTTTPAVSQASFWALCT